MSPRILEIAKSYVSSQSDLEGDPEKLAEELAEAIEERIDDWINDAPKKKEEGEG